MAYRSSTVQQNFSTTSPIGALPAGTALDDVLLAFFVHDLFGATVTPPAGWSLVSGDASTATPDGQYARVFTKVATGSEPATWTWTTGTNANATIIVGAWSGRNSAGSLISAATPNTSGNATPISISATGVTALAGDDIAFFAMLDISVGTDAWSFTASPASFTERQDDVNNGFIVTSLHTRDNVSAGATGSLTATATRSAGSGTAGWGVIVVSIPQAVAIDVPIAWIVA